MKTLQCISWDNKDGNPVEFYNSKSYLEIGLSEYNVNSMEDTYFIGYLIFENPFDSSDHIKMLIKYEKDKSINMLIDQFNKNFHENFYKHEYNRRLRYVNNGINENWLIFKNHKLKITTVNNQLSTVIDESIFNDTILPNNETVNIVESLAYKNIVLQYRETLLPKISILENLLNVIVPENNKCKFKFGNSIYFNHVHTKRDEYIYNINPNKIITYDSLLYSLNIEVNQINCYTLKYFCKDDENKIKSLNQVNYINIDEKYISSLGIKILDAAEEEISSSGFSIIHIISK